MFGRAKRTGPAANTRSSGTTARQKMTYDIPIIFGIMFVLAIAELVFSVDSFQYLQRMHRFTSSTERARLAFLIFSSVRTIGLAAVYVGFHCARKYLHSMFHTIFVVLSTIFWIVSGVLIHQMWGLIECGGVGALQGGLNECHELKIIEILAWVLAGVSILATIPVLMEAGKRRKRQAERKTETSG